jgi:predicted permease
MVDTVPMREGNNQIGYWTTPVAPPDNQQPSVLANCVTPDYLKVMGIALLQGRFLNDQDRTGRESVVVIDEVMAQQAFGGDALGKHVWIGLGTDPLRVVGVVGHVRYWGPAGDDQGHVRAQLYYPFAQVPDRFIRRWSELMSISVRTSVPPLNLVESLKRQLRGATGDQVLYEVRTMEQLASATLARQRFLLMLFGVFAGLALLLACIGLYGVLAYLGNQRVREMGVRMALGASAHQVMWLMLNQSLGMILTGLSIGVVAAFAAGHVLLRLVQGMRSIDASAFAFMLPILVAAALFASFVPARRASRVDPMKALRQE